MLHITMVEQNYFTCPSRKTNPGRCIYRQTLYHVAVKAGFYSEMLVFACRFSNLGSGFYGDMVECLPVDPATWVRWPGWDRWNIFSLRHNKYDFKGLITSPFRGSFTLFILMNFSIHIIDTIGMELSIFYCKGLPVKISINYAFLSLTFIYG